MCTSFAVYSSRTLYGLNFDFPEVEVKFELVPESAGEVFYLALGWDNQFHRFAGINSAGLFATAQILVSQFEINLQPGENQVSPYELFSKSLAEGQTVQQVLNILDSRRLSYSTSRKGHQLYADRYGDACVLEPGPDGNRLYRADGPVMVMANRPMERELARLTRGESPQSHDRFGIARELIEGKLPGFSVEDGFEVLRRVALSRGRFTTQCSIICDPWAGEVYLALRRDFTRIWKADLNESRLVSYAGFQKRHDLTLKNGGLCASDLIG